jgi:YVTN family beta-propeller protein
MKKELKLKRMCLSPIPILMGFSVMLMAVGVSGLKAGAKPLENEVIDVIPGLNQPVGVVVSANSKYIYVAEATNNTLAVIDAATHQIIDNAIFAGTEPSGVVLTPNGKTLYVASQAQALGFATSDLILAQDLLNSEVNFGLAVSPNGKSLYVVGEGTPGQIAVFDTAGAGSFVKNITVGNDSIDVAFTPNGKTAYVTNSSDNTVSVINVKTGSVTGSPITGLLDPFGINITANGDTAYVLNVDGVGVIDTKTNTVTTSIDLSAYGNGTGFFMGMTPDGKYLYVPVTKSGSKGSLVVINTVTNLVTTPAPAAQLGDAPAAIAISPDGKHAYVTDVLDGTVTVIAISGD